MAVTNRIQVQAQVASTPTMAVPRSGGPSESIDFLHTFTEGLNLGQANWSWISRRSLAKAGTEDLDLYGSLTELDGATINGVKLRLLVILNEGPGTLELSRPGANGVPLFKAAGDAIYIPAGCMFLWSESDDDAGIAITTATGDLLTVTEANVDVVTYKVMIAGT